MQNDGKEAEVAFVKHWEKVGHIERFRDKRDLSGLNKGAQLADFAKPSDFLVSSPDHPLHYAEVKSTVNATRFDFAKIQKGQSAAALKSARRGDGRYTFYIFSYPLGRWFTMSCKAYAAALDDGNRSIKFDALTPWRIS